MKRLYVLIILLTVIASCSEPTKTYTVTCEQDYTDAAKRLSITFNYGSKLFKRGNYVFPIEDIEVNSYEWSTTMRYDPPFDYKQAKGTITMSTLTILMHTNPITVAYNEWRNGESHPSTVMLGWLDKVEYECNIPPNFEYVQIK